MVKHATYTITAFATLAHAEFCVCLFVYFLIQQKRKTEDTFLFNDILSGVYVKTSETKIQLRTTKAVWISTKIHSLEFSL